MEDFLNPSPINLNPQNSSTSPFLNDFSFEGGGLNFGENIFSKKIEEEKYASRCDGDGRDERSTTSATQATCGEAAQEAKRRRINDFDGDILSKYSGEGSKKLTFAGKIREFFKGREKKIESWDDLKTLNSEDFEDFMEFFGSLLLPGVYRSKTMKASLKKLVTLNKLAHELVTKKIPYGEATEHYNTLIENLSLATNIQADLKKRIS